MENIKVRFLGTNGWYDTETGSTVCILIETPAEYVVLDAGNGLYKLDRYIKDEKKPIYLFISHFHLDHIFGLHVLAKFRFKQGLSICVQPGGKKFLADLIKQPLTLALTDLKTKTEVIDLSNGNLPFLDEWLVLRHVSRCIGFRFNFQGKIISYVPDTGPCPNADRLAQGADLLITECAFAPGQKNADWPHLNPEKAAEIARDSGANRLILVHFDAEIYDTMKKRKLAQKKAREIFKNTIVSVDDLAVTL